MLYRYYRDRDGIAPIAIIRKAEKQSGSYAVLATEEPSGEQRQVLVMDGMTTNRDRIPVLIGDDITVRAIVGSVVIRTQGQQLVGVLGFASDKAAQEVRQRYLAGELTVNLITNPIAGVEISRGQTFRGVDGPAIVLTKWEPLHVALE